MKNILLAVALSCSLSPVFSQVQIEKSAPFAEVPAKVGYDKVLLLKNGKTAYINYTGDGSMHVAIYGKDHKLAIHSEIKGKDWDASSVKKTLINGCYEINGEVVVFVQQMDRRHPVLYRIRINEDDGKLLKEDELATTKAGFEMTGFELSLTLINVVKDPYSDCYAVIFNDDRGSDASNAMKVLHYNGSHALIGSALLNAPGKRADKIAYLDAVVLNSKSVFVSTYFKGTHDEDSKVFVYKLNAGDKEMTSKALDFTEDFHKSQAQMGYNKASGQIEMLITSFVKKKMFSSKNYYSSSLCFINPETMDVTGVAELSNAKINAYARTALADESNFAGVPQGMVINSRNETIVLNQGLTVVVSKSGSYTGLKDIGMSKISADGIEKEGYLLPFYRSVRATVPDMYLGANEKGVWDNGRELRIHKESAQDFSVRYLAGATNDYVLVNNFKKRIEKSSDVHIGKKDMKKSKLNSELFTMRNGNVAKDYLFGKPVGKHMSNSCLLVAGDYNDGIYATVMITRTGKKHKTANLVWIGMP